MLSSIHPFGERSRNNRFWLTAGAHVAGSTLGGLTLGALMGVIAWLGALVWNPDSGARPLVLGALALAAAVVDALGRERSLPTRVHQVNENWLQQYRGWVYGFGFGYELGFGISTIITTALVHVVIAAMILTGSFWASLLIGGAFGLTRGLSVLAAARVDSPDALRAFHRRLDVMRGRSRMAGVTALGLTSIVGLSAAIW